MREPASPETALARHPRDLAVASVYADWLSQAGDPLGEYVALRVALETRTEDRRRLAERATALLVEHGRAWRARWSGGLDLRADAFSFAGLPGFASFGREDHAKPLDRIDAQLARLPIQSLVVEADTLEQLERLEGLAALRRVPELLLRGPEPSFDWKHYRLEEEVATWLTRARLDHLRRLDIYAVHLARADKRAFLDALPELRILGLTGTALDASVVGELATSPVARQLVQLDVSVPDAGDDAFVAARRLSALRTLRLASPRFGHELIVPAGENGLEELALTADDVDAGGLARALAAMPVLRRLTLENVEPAVLATVTEVAPRLAHLGIASFDDGVAPERIRRLFDRAVALQSLDTTLGNPSSVEAVLPFAEFGGGSLRLLVDLAPSARGTSGQVIAFTHDPDEMTFVADSFDAFLARSLRELERDPEGSLDGPLDRAYEG